MAWFLYDNGLRHERVKLLPKCAVHYLCHLKPNNIIGQSKTTNTKKTVLSMIDFV